MHACAGGVLAGRVPDLAALIGGGSLLYAALYLLSRPLGSLSAHAASGNVAAATLLCAAWWRLGAAAVAAAAPPLLPRFYSGLAAWALAYGTLLLSEQLWPTSLEAEAARPRARVRWGAAAEGCGEGGAGAGAESGRGVWWLQGRGGGVIVSRGVGLAVIRAVLAVTPAWAVWACVG